MTLATHAVVGATLAQLFPQNYALAFGLGMVSHFVLDAIPHWDYSLSSRQGIKDPMDGSISFLSSREGKKDLMKIFADISLGTLVSFLFFLPNSFSSLALLFFGIAGAVMPDFLQSVYFKMKVAPISWLHYFHVKIAHSSRDINNYPAVGITLQLIVVTTLFLFLG